MRPLSLATFAELEAAGITLTSLTGKGASDQWARLFAHLAGRHESDTSSLLAALLKDPIAFKRFQHAILDAIQGREDLAATQPTPKRRTVKNPLERTKRDGDQHDMREEEDEPEQPLDVSYLLLVSRLSGIGLSDLSRMTFRGVLALQEWLKEHPPDPPMQGLLGRMG